MVPLPPADATDLVVRNERRLRPDAILVEPAADRQAHREEVRIVEEHHRLAERLPVEKDELRKDEQAERGAETERKRILRRLRRFPREQRRPAPTEKQDVIVRDLQVRAQ